MANKGRPKVERVTVSCAGCGKSCQRYSWQVAKNKTGRFFCSKACRDLIGSKPRRKADSICAVCGKSFYPGSGDKGIYCSRACHNIGQTKRVERACEMCGKAFEAKPSATKRFCSKECEGRARWQRPQERSHNGKPVLLTPTGYVKVWEPSRPPRRRWVLEHRLVAERELGRTLNTDEHVHHINGDRADNRPENLMVVGSGAHALITSAHTQERIGNDRAELERYRKLYGPLPGDRAMHVNILCRNPNEDRVIPRFARYLRDYLGWSLTAKPLPDADLYYLSGYFEESLMRPWPDKPVAAYFTHREEQPPGNEKAAQFDRMAARVSLRIATAALYAEPLTAYGPTAQITPPVERDRFTIPRAALHPRPVVGFAGYTYANKRKGEDLAREVVRVMPGVTWRGSGRGWPAPTKHYDWPQMPAFYQSLDVLVVTARVEGVPMPPLEALACGVSVVVPMGVGLLDELPYVRGIYRYFAGNTRNCADALRQALDERAIADREQLRAVTEPYTIGAWCEQHALAFAEVFQWSAVC